MVDWIMVEVSKAGFLRDLIADMEKLKSDEVGECDNDMLYWTNQGIQNCIELVKERIKPVESHKCSGGCGADIVGGLYCPKCCEEIAKTR
jgi:hypothetical protein